MPDAAKLSSYPMNSHKWCTMVEQKVAQVVSDEVTHEAFMRLALAEAAKAAALGEVPVGAVLVAADGHTVLAATHNQPISGNDPTAHAEILAIRQAAAVLGNYRLDGCTLYITLEPCTMCIGALVHARIASVVYAADEPKAGSLYSARALMDPEASGYYNHRFGWQRGVLAESSRQLLQAFFKGRRG
jgi:tRNA(adenine34) deaminase